MSAIASFYLLPKSKSEELIGAAKAQEVAISKKKWGIFKPKLPLNPDPFWSYLFTQTNELADFPYSGYLLLDIDDLVESALQGDDSDELATKLSKITGSSFVTYSFETAKNTIRLLEETSLTDKTIKDFLDREERGDEFPEIAGALRDAVSCLKAWLEKVTPETIGVLNIG